MKKDRLSEVLWKSPEQVSPLPCCSFCLQWQVTDNTNQSIHQSNVDGNGRSIEGSDFCLIDHKEAHPGYFPRVQYFHETKKVIQWKKSLFLNYFRRKGVAYHKGSLLASDPAAHGSNLEDPKINWLIFECRAPSSKRKNVNGHIVQFLARFAVKLVRSNYQILAHSFFVLFATDITLHWWCNSKQVSLALQ